MVIKILDHVERCYSNDDGDAIYRIIKQQLDMGEKVVVSFVGVYSVPSSFVNSAFIPLLEDYSFDEIKRNIRFINTTSQINEMIKKRFNFEVNERNKLVYV